VPWVSTAGRFPPVNARGETVIINPESSRFRARSRSASRLGATKRSLHGRRRRRPSSSNSRCR
jgi:hypothetical protein